MPEQILINAISSHGDIIFNAYTGFVLSAHTGFVLNVDLDNTSDDPKNTFGPAPVWMNVVEYNLYYGTEDKPRPLLDGDDIDILSIGFVDAAGEYSPPGKDWRIETERCHFESGLFDLCNAARKAKVPLSSVAEILTSRLNKVKALVEAVS